MGEAILERLGRGITIQGGGNGKYALRGILVSVALDKEEGLTLLNVLRKLPLGLRGLGVGARANLLRLHYTAGSQELTWGHLNIAKCIELISVSDECSYC
jgi:hypothetical protein